MVATLPAAPALDGNALIRSVCRESFADFVRVFWPVLTAEPLQWNWHLDILCAELQEQALRVFRRETKKHDTAFNVSPGTSKSSVASVLFPAWCWTFAP